MLNSEASAARSAAKLPLLAAADLQDTLLMVRNDLDRLQSLLAHACDELMLGFHGATERIQAGLAPAHAGLPAPELWQGVLRDLGGAITALQFQDMASQLIAHTHQRLRNCADRIAQETIGDDDDGAAVIAEAPSRPNPVTQDEMDAGSVELF
jgi:hypothetical protein